VQRGASSWDYVAVDEATVNINNLFLWATSVL